MTYELWINGQPGGRFETSDEAEAHARSLLQQSADNSLEIIDLSTGRPYAPAASAEEREAMARKIGF
jgi:hypothetical protein